MHACVLQVPHEVLSDLVQGSADSAGLVPYRELTKSIMHQVRGCGCISGCEHVWRQDVGGAEGGGGVRFYSTWEGWREAAALPHQEL